MKETPPDIDIARELDIFTKAHFSTNDSNDHHQQQTTHTIHSSITTDYNQQHYHFSPSFTFTSSTGTSSPPSTSYLHPSPATSILRPVPTHSIAASNALIPTHTPPKNPETPSIYENYSLSYQNAPMADAAHSHSGSPLSGYTTPTPYSATQHTAPSSSSSGQQQKQQTFDEFMSMMNMVDQRLQRLGHHGNPSVPLLSASAGSSPMSMSPTHSTTMAPTINHALPNASLYTHTEEQLSAHGITPKPTSSSTLMTSSSTPVRGGRGRRKKVIPLIDRKGKKPTPTSKTASMDVTTVPIQQVEQHSDSDSEGGSSDLEEEEEEGETQHNHRDDYARDKRRRNTEASARFRVKKKMREQALRRTADEMTLRSQQLQQRVHELEKEIKWLRELIVEKKQSHSTTT